MSEITAFGAACTLGEGALWHPEREQLFWFDIPAGTLHCANAEGGQRSSWNFGEPASAAGWVDWDTLIVATASGLQKFSVANGSWSTIVEMEADDAVTRSNDGRIGPDGAFWIGTMGRKVEPRAGAYYRYANGELRQLFDMVSVPNATCFSPDGRTAYLSDTFRKVIWRWALDEAGAPVGEREVHIDLTAEGLNPDGAVCDSEGCLWNAQWDASRLACYSPDGRLKTVVELPVSRPTCPAFGGPELKTLYVTSAREGLSEEQLAAQPLAGQTLRLDVDVAGLPEHRAAL